MRTYHMPTKIISGIGVLGGIADHAASLGMRRPMLVTDPVIRETPFFAEALDRMSQTAEEVTIFDGCGVDARLHHIDTEAARAADAACDGVIGIGGGSVICTAKGIAIAARNGASLERLKGIYSFEEPLPMIMVPTTAGSGSEVSQWTLVKDDATHRKFSVGGPQAFPQLAILDPVTLSTLPPRPAAMAGVDALCHAVEAYFSREASEITDAMALAAARSQFTNLIPAIKDGTEDARLACLVASSMANIACGSARLGLGHALSMPLEAHFDLPHAHGVGPFLLTILDHNAAVAPERVCNLALALGILTGDNVGENVARLQTALEGFFETLDLPARIPSDGIDRTRLEEMAVHSITSLSRGRTPEQPVTTQTEIICPNIRATTVAEGVALYERTLA